MVRKPLVFNVVGFSVRFVVHRDEDFVLRDDFIVVCGYVYKGEFEEQALTIELFHNKILIHAVRVIVRARRRWKLSRDRVGERSTLDSQNYATLHVVTEREAEPLDTVFDTETTRNPISAGTSFRPLNRRPKRNQEPVQTGTIAPDRPARIAHNLSEDL